MTSPSFLHDHRRQPLGDLVEQQQACAGAQNARHRQHLLLAAGQARARAAAPFGQVGKHRVDLVERHAAAAHLRRQQQVFLGGQAGEDAALFRAVADAQPRDAVRRHRDGLAPVHHHRAGAPSGQAEYGLERGGPAGAIAPEQGHDLAALHRQVDAVKNMRFAVERVQVGDAQHLDIRRVGASHARSRRRPRAPPDSSTPRRTAPRRESSRAAAR